MVLIGESGKHCETGALAAAWRQYQIIVAKRERESELNSTNSELT